MRVIETIHPELIGILSNFTEWFEAQDKTTLHVHRSKMDPDYACSPEYLSSIQTRQQPKHDGFPEEVYGIDLAREAPNDEYVKVLTKLDEELMAFFGCRFNAVKMYYPGPSGFMGWHHNANCPGYNILLSYNKEGNGYFKYQDPLTKEFVTLHDKAGWNIKVGYFGSWEEPNKQVWHCARANTDRFTLGYVIPHEGLWGDMVEEIAGYTK